VLSGFLIAGLLFKEYAAHGKIAFGRFFIRRGFKIYPPYYAMIFVTLLPLFFRMGNAKTLREVLPWLVYLQNYFYTPVGAIWGHTWSLAIEEQFYLFIPLLLIVLTKLRYSKENPFTAVPMIFLIIGSGCLLMRILTAQHTPYSGALLSYFHLRLDSLFCGVYVAYIYHYCPSWFANATSRLRHWLLGIGSALLLPAFCFQLEQCVFIYTAGLTIFYLGSVCILMAVVDDQAKSGVLPRTLASIGSHSYSIYLWHFPIAWLSYRLLRNVRGPTLSWCCATALYLVGSMVVAILASNAIEIPMLRLRDRWYPSRSSGK